jgi:hypothetical protein
VNTSCYQCGTQMARRCPSCGRYVCVEHSESIAQYDCRVFCKKCLASGQRMTRLLLWFCVPILVIWSAFLALIAYVPL